MPEQYHEALMEGLDEEAIVVHIVDDFVVAAVWYVPYPERHQKRDTWICGELEDAIREGADRLTASPLESGEQTETQRERPTPSIRGPEGIPGIVLPRRAPYAIPVDDIR